MPNIAIVDNDFKPIWCDCGGLITCKYAPAKHHHCMHEKVLLCHYWDFMMIIPRFMKGNGEHHWLYIACRKHREIITAGTWNKKTHFRAKPSIIVKLQNRLYDEMQTAAAAAAAYLRSILSCHLRFWLMYCIDPTLTALRKCAWLSAWQEVVCPAVYSCVSSVSPEQPKNSLMNMKMQYFSSAIVLSALLFHSQAFATNWLNIHRWLSLSTGIYRLQPFPTVAAWWNHTLSTVRYAHLS